MNCGVCQCLMGPKGAMNLETQPLEIIVQRLDHLCRDFALLTHSVTALGEKVDTLLADNLSDCETIEDDFQAFPGSSMRFSDAEEPEQSMPLL